MLEGNPKACILIMTTYDGDEDIFKCLSQGAKGYLLKDAPRQEILSAIADMVIENPLAKAVNVTMGLSIPRTSVDSTR